MRGSRKFCQRVSNFDNVFSPFFWWWEILLKAGHLLAFRWRADGGPPLNAGLVALWFSTGSGSVLLGKPCILWFFRWLGGVGSGPPVPFSGPPVCKWVQTTISSDSCFWFCLRNWTRMLETLRPILQSTILFDQPWLADWLSFKAYRPSQQYFSHVGTPLRERERERERERGGGRG